MQPPDQDDYLELTAHSLLFQVLDEAGRRNVLRMAQAVSYPAGTVIIRQGERGDEIYLVRNGEVRISAQRDGEEIELEVLSSGVIFGEVAELGKVNRTATVTALTDVDLLRFDGRWLIGLLKLYPSAQRVLDQIVSRRAEATIKKMFE